MEQSQARIYLDYAATTPVDHRVLDAMLPYFDVHFGNPSSIHFYGQQAESAIEKSRLIIAACLDCNPQEIIFTSCGSESDNLALRGVAFAERSKRGANHILISPIEHHAVSVTAQQLKNVHGFEIEHIPVDKYGCVSPEKLERQIRKTTALVSVIYANNEIGSVNPIEELGKICQRKGIPFHSDAVQAAAYLPVNVKSLHVDLFSIGAHKFYGPKGVGALYVRKGTPIQPIITGGSQELGLRAGTHNTPYIVGLAKAFQLAQTDRSDRINHVQPLRDQMIDHILENIPESRLTGHPNERMPNHASFVFKDVDGNALLTALDIEGFACSSGSACRTGDPEPSEVLTELGFTYRWALGSLRVTLGTFTTSDEIEKFLIVLPKVITRLRNFNS